MAEIPLAVFANEKIILFEDSLSVKNTADWVYGVNDNVYEYHDGWMGLTANAVPNGMRLNTNREEPMQHVYGDAVYEVKFKANPPSISAESAFASIRIKGNQDNFTTVGRTVQLQFYYVNNQYKARLLYPRGTEVGTGVVPLEGIDVAKEQTVRLVARGSNVTAYISQGEIERSLSIDDGVPEGGTVIIHRTVAVTEPYEMQVKDFKIYSLAALKDIKLDGYSLTGFDPTQKNITVHMNADEAKPIINAVPFDQQAVISYDDLDENTAIINVETPYGSAEYTINYIMQTFRIIKNNEELTHFEDWCKLTASVKPRNFINKIDEAASLIFCLAIKTDGNKLLAMEILSKDMTAEVADETIALSIDFGETDVKDITAELYIWDKENLSPVCKKVAKQYLPSPKNEMYVALNGSDANKGTKGEPFRTLEKARDEIREMKTGGLPEGGVTVYVREGIYKTNKSFELTSFDSGEPGKPITYKGYDGERVTFYGAKDIDKNMFAPVEDAWVLARIIDENARNKVLQLDLRQAGISNCGENGRRGFNITSGMPPIMLYINGQKMTLARWPNNDTVAYSEIINIGPTLGDANFNTEGGTFKVGHNRFQYWQDADEIWVDGIFGSPWEWSYNKIAHIDAQKGHITLSYGEISGIKTTFAPNYHFYENLLEELDVPGEYYIDRENGILYLMPPAEFEFADCTISLTDNKQFFFRLDDVSNVFIENFVFDYGRRGAITVVGNNNFCENIIISNIEVQNVANAGVRFNKAKNSGIKNSAIHHVGEFGVHLSNPSSYSLEAENLFVKNCRIHDVSNYIKVYKPAVYLNGTGFEISHNEIYNAPHQALILRGNNHLIEYNEVYNANYDFSDMGAVYAHTGQWPQMRGHTIRRNYFHDIGNEKMATHVLYFDNQSMGFTVEENIFYKIGNESFGNSTGNHSIHLNGASYVSINNNMFIDTRNGVYVSAHSLGNHDLTSAWQASFEEYNIVEGSVYADNYPELLSFWDDWNANYKKSRHISCESNLFYNVDMQSENIIIQQKDNATLVTSNNFVAQTNPGFVDFSERNFNLIQNAEVFSHIPGFKPIPFSEIGLKKHAGTLHN
ncbi:MAG: right-handed parallel beta-helix repeat-containing protein [Firmicutes bacterium]|nr:right-handed parallel beta-helix repeat-containing protein [Bacillota bacterium]